MASLQERAQSALKFVYLVFAFLFGLLSLTASPILGVVLLALILMLHPKVASYASKVSPLAAISSRPKIIYAASISVVMLMSILQPGTDSAPAEPKSAVVSEEASPALLAEQKRKAEEELETDLLATINVNDLLAIYKVDKSIPANLTESMNCQNARNVSYNGNTGFVSTRVVKNSAGDFGSVMEATASCEREYGGTNMSSLCISRSETPVEVAISSIKSEPFVIVTTPNPDNPNCSYLDEIPLNKFDAITSGEIYSEGNCGSYRQERKSRKYIVCLE
jgi:hypothetical protein